MSAKKESTTKKFGSSTRVVPAPSQKAQKWYNADDEPEAKKVSVFAARSGLYVCVSFEGFEWLSVESSVQIGSRAKVWEIRWRGIRNPQSCAHIDNLEEESPIPNNTTSTTTPRRTHMQPFNLEKKRTGEINKRQDAREEGGNTNARDLGNDNMSPAVLNNMSHEEDNDGMMNTQD